MRKLWLLAPLILCLYIRSFAHTESYDTVTNKHLLVKTDILFPIGLMVEYKTKEILSYQLAGHYFIRPLWKQDNEDLQLEGSYELHGEFRYYIRNQFIGAYFTYAHLEDNMSMYAPYKQYNYSIGPMYGYQKEWGRFNLEGLIGIGLSKNIHHEGFTKVGLYFFKDDDYYSPFLALRLSIGAGFRIF